jgi:hypothetical protein
MRVLLLLVLSTMISAQTLQEMSIHHVYIPMGYDDNDQIELSVSGSLPGLCYSAPRIEATREGNTVFIKAKAFFKPGSCDIFPIAFFEKISLPPAPAGEYNIAFHSQGIKQEKTLIVAKAENQRIDNFVYAPIDRLYEDEESREIVLVGEMNIDCMVFDKMELISNGMDAVSLLPVMKKIKNDCVEVKEKLIIRYELPYFPELKRGILVHVRAMNGNSINMLFQNLAKK